MYNEFANYLNGVNKIDSNIYKYLKYRFGDNVKPFLEKYILDSDCNPEFIEKIKYYIDVEYNPFDVSSDENFDINLRTYLKEIYNYPKITEEEEKIIIKRLKDFEKEFDTKGINDAYINNILYKNNYNNISNNLINRKVQLKYLKKNCSNMKDLDIFQKYVDYLVLKDYFLNCNLKLVVFLARIKTNNDSELLDNIQYGNMGLMKALDNYDLKHDNKFSTYAAIIINNYMYKKMAYNSSLLKVSYQMHELVSYYKKYVSLFYNSNGYKPSKEQIIEYFMDKLKNYSNFKNCKNYNDKIVSLVEKIEKLIVINNPVSLRTYIDDGDDNEAFLEETVIDDSCEIDGSLMSMDLKNRFKKVIVEIPTKYACILMLRNGIRVADYIEYEDMCSVFNNVDKKIVYQMWNSGEKYTNKFISKLLGVTIQWVSEMESVSKKKIKKYKNKFSDYM